MDSQYIRVSGVLENELLFNDNSNINVNFGIPDSFGQVWIRDISTSFGFNGTPHSVQLTLVAKNQININQNKIGKDVNLRIGELKFYGYISHVDNTSDNNGYVTQITCEDKRKRDLNKYLIHTEPLLQSNLSNIIVVPKVLDTEGTLHKAGSPLWLMNNYGATYQEIYSAITQITSVQLPPVSTIANRLGDIETYRWSFSLTPLFNAVSQIFDDCNFDFYYYNGQIRLIDRNKSISVDTSFFDNKYKTSVREGYDNTDRPTQYSILGAKKEGGVGMNGIVQYENLVKLKSKNIANDKFLPCWTEMKISYHDQNGVLKRYRPTELELKMALKSIEHWVYYKKDEFENTKNSFARGWMESRLDPAPYGLEGNAVEAALAFGGGREDVRRVIKNRRAIECNWLCQWYESVSKYARTYFGKMYSIKPSEDFLRNCDVIDRAWVHDNVDQRNISSALSPFYNHGYMRAFCKIHTDNIKGYGVDGTQAPLSFEEWNEYKSWVYLPLNVELYSPTEDNEERYPGINDTRLFISLPEIVVSGLETPAILKNLVTLDHYDKTAALITDDDSVEGNFKFFLTEKDVNNPRWVIRPLPSIDNFFIPVKYNIRYGDDGSATKGNLNGTVRAEIDDKFAPWTRTNPDNPTVEMREKALEMISNNNIDSFYECEIVGLPEINFFANFADENNRPQHPFTSIDVTVDSNGMLTRYNSKLQLQEILRANKIDWIRFRDRLDKIQHFANLSKLQTDLNLTLEPQNVEKEKLDTRRQKTFSFISSSNEEEEEDEIQEKSFVKAVTIKFKSRHYAPDPLDEGNWLTQELYRGEDDYGNTWPPNWVKVNDAMSNAATNKDPYNSNQYYVTGSPTEGSNWIESGDKSNRYNTIKKGFAPCQDGYLRKGIPALYHQEEIEGTIYCYFTGGVPLEDARLVKITSKVKKQGSVYYVDVETIPHPRSEDSDTYIFKKVPFAQNDVVTSQGYAPGQIVPIMHNKMMGGGSSNASMNIDQQDENTTAPADDLGALRPGSTHVVNGAALGDLYIANSPVMGAMAVTVVQPPDENGNKGIVAKVDDEDALYGITGSTDENENIPVSFIGIPPTQIFAGDYGIMTKGNSVWNVIIMKAMFTPFSAFGE